jgi:NAD(P)-dependent dehydrogenase (short-subunit alcohol dehydrogenase family)
MRVLVLGAASGIGWSICKKLAPSNKLLLAGRDGASLEELAAVCRKAGAASVTVTVCDLGDGVKALLHASHYEPIDLVINVASSTSQLRDSEIEMPALRRYIEVDLLAPVELVRGLVLMRPGHPLRVLMISSVLAVVNSPEREIYGSLKALQERCLNRLSEDFAQVKLQIFRIGKVLRPGLPTQETDELAECVASVLATAKREYMYGAGGAALVVLSQLQPLLLRGILRLRRIAMQRTRGVLVES